MQAGQLFRKHKRKTCSGIHALKSGKAFCYLVTPSSFLFIHCFYLRCSLKDVSNCIFISEERWGPHPRTTSGMPEDGGDGICLGETRKLTLAWTHPWDQKWGKSGGLLLARAFYHNRRKIRTPSFPFSGRRRGIHFLWASLWWDRAPRVNFSTQHSEKGGCHAHLLSLPW